MSAPEKSAKILVVDDEDQIRRAVKSILSTRKYAVTLAENGEAALDVAVDVSPDLIILDMTMPGLSGIDVCRELRAWCKAPILILSVRGGEADKVAALDAGADDYITKPFSAGELLARVRALLRRAGDTPATNALITVGDLEVDLPRRRVLRAGQELDLTRIEFDILAYLAKNMDCVVTSKLLLENVWGPEYGGDTQTLRVHISHLRKKIEPHATVPRYLLTEPGVGFRLSSS